MSTKRLTVAVLLAALVLASVPAQAAHRSTRPAVAEVGENRTVLHRLWQFFAGLLLKEGMSIDPDGNTVTVDEGVLIDPDGAKG
jgi:hypothetical protein